MTIETINPATGELIKSYTEFSSDEVNSIIDQSHQAYLLWKRVGVDERAAKMKKAAQILLDRVDLYAKLITQEMGKPISQARGEVKKCALVCEHYADKAAEYLASHHITTDMAKSYVTYQPLGTVFAIMPWNFPFWQVFRFAAPALMAGNATLLKHAPISTGAALAIENVFKEAGFSEGLFRSLIIDVELAAQVISHPKVVAVTITGSERAGRSVAATAGAVLKKVVLELGGCAPYIN